MVFSKTTIRIIAVFAGSLFSLGGQVLGQQGSQNSDKQAPSANGKSQSGSNAFPMAQSEAAAKADGQKNAQEATQPAKSGNGASRQNQAKPTPSQENPFPEAQSKAATKGEGGTGGSANSPAGSSSSTNGYSSSNAHLPPPDLGQGNLKTQEKVDTFTRDHTLDGRIQDDLNVADLYMKNGNYRGGYLRYQDALQYDPQNDTAMYGLAEAMCKENLTSEAMAHFKSYVTDNPQGQYAKKAERMLAHPEKCMHNR